MQSSIFRFFANVFHALARFFDASLFGRAFNRLTSFCGRVFKHSVPGRFFAGQTQGTWFSESLFGKLFMLPITIMRLLACKVGSFCSRTAQNSGIYFLLSSWHSISIRTYGVALLFFSLFYGVFRTLWAQPTLIERLCVAGLLLVAIASIIINRSLKSLFKGSTFLTAFGGLFCPIRKDVDSKLFLKDPEFFLPRPVAALFVGLILAFFASFMSPLFALLVLGGLVYLLLALKSTTFCVFTIILASPLLPTMALAGLCVLCVISFGLKLAFNAALSLRPVPLAGYIVVFALTLLLSTLNSFTFVKSLQILFIYYAFMLFYFVAYQTLDTPKKWRAAVVSFLMVAGFVALYGVYQNFAGVSSTQSWVDAEMFTDIKIRVYSTFDNPNVLGEFLVLLIPVSLAIIWRSHTDCQKLTYSGIFALLAVCLIFTWSRGAWLGVALAVALYFVLMDKRWCLLGVLFVFALPFVLMSDSAIVNRLLSIGNTADTSTAYRVSIWRASLHMIRDFWLSGVGIGSDAFSTIYPKYALAGANFALHSHNLFLQILVESGICGIVSFLVMILAFVKNSFSALVYQKKDKLDQALCLAMTAGVLGFLFQGLTDNVWYNYKMVLIFWMMLALASSASAPDYCGGDR